MLDSPAADAIIAVVRTALAAGIAPGFEQKVAANALGIAERELALGGQLGEEERARLVRLLEHEGDLETLNRLLGRDLREREMSLDHPHLVEHLILTSMAKLAVDQPRYPAFDAWQEGIEPSE